MARLTSDDRSLLAAVLAQLDMEDEWTVERDDGVGFVAAELGTSLTLEQTDSGARVLRVECRLASGVSPTDDALLYLDTMNHFEDVGRLVHDPETGVVAVTASIDLDPTTVEMAAFVVASVVCAGEAAALYDRPRRQLRGNKAITLVAGRLRPRPHPIVNFYAASVVPRGERQQATLLALPMLQDSMVLDLPGWYVEHEKTESVATCDDRTLLVRVSRHPALGWGLMLACTTLGTADDTELAVAAARNRSVQRTGGVGTWALVDGHMEQRVFLPGAFLHLANKQMPPAVLPKMLSGLAGSAAAKDGPEADAGPVLAWPEWPGDTEGTALARRSPTNEGPDAPDTFTWVDRMSRPAYTGPAEFAAWRASLDDGDLADSRVAGYVAWWTREYDARCQRRRTD